MQTTGFVEFGRCERCGWPHHKRAVLVAVRWPHRKAKRRPARVVTRCCNCELDTDVTLSDQETT